MLRLPIPFRRTAPSRAAPALDDPLTPALLARVRAIELRARRLVNTLFLGEYHAVFRGRGLEFDELRPYVPGDDVRALDWNAYARTGEPFIRRYREDRDLTVIFVVDVSASQFAGAAPVAKSALAAEIAAVLALAAVRNKDRVGLLLFAGRPQRYVRPAGGATSSAKSSAPARHIPAPTSQPPSSTSSASSAAAPPSSSSPTSSPLSNRPASAPPPAVTT